MDTIISSAGDTEVNVELHNTDVKTITPKRNAVIVDFVPDNTGDFPTTKKIVTIECVDDEMYEEMQDYAIRLARRR